MHVPYNRLRAFWIRLTRRLRSYFPKRHIDQEAAFRLLCDVDDVLRAHQIPYWLEAGTCLGLYRDNQFVPIDDDIDIGIFIEDARDLHQIKHALEAKGMRYYREFGTPERGYELTFIRDGIYLDFFFFYEEGEERWHGAYLNGKMLALAFDKQLFADRHWHTFRGRSFPLPSPPERYLEARYGDWRTPNGEWDSGRDPLCIKQ